MSGAWSSPGPGGADVARVLVLACGNELRADDGIGPEVARALAARLPADAADVLVCHQLSPELSDAAARAELVVFVDAAAAGVPGTVRVEPVLPAESVPGGFTHSLTPATLLALTAALYGRTPRGVIVTIAGESFGFGSELSGTARHAVPVALDCLKEVIAYA